MKLLRQVAACLLVLTGLFAGVVGAQTPKAPANFSASSAPVSLSVAGLHAVGNRILNSHGQAVTLRGVDKAGSEYMCLGSGSTAFFDGPNDQNDVNNMLSWGINVVRLPYNEGCWLGLNGLPIANYSAAAYQAAMTAEVNLLTSNNIAVIVDLQWAAPGTHQAYPSPQALIPLPDADHALTFWTSVANAYKTNSSVIFDPFNEPYPDNNQDTTLAWTCLRDGCTSIYPNDGSSYTGVGMQSIVNTIRAAGAGNLIMVPGVQFTNSLSQWLTYRPTDSANNEAAEVHLYQGQSCSSTSCYDANIAPVLAGGFPVIAGEIGENDCQHTPFLDPTMIWLDAHFASYLGWAWNTNDCSGFPSLLSAYDGTPTSFGVGLRDHLLSLRGSTPPIPVPVSYFTNSYPFGLAVGRTSGGNVLANDGTVYYLDVPATGYTQSFQFFTPFTTADTIAGTSDPTLYANGRAGQFGTFAFAVQNGSYDVSLMLAYNTTYSLTGTIPTDPWGQDQHIQGQQPTGATCWSSAFSNTNTYMDFTGGITPGSGYTNGTYTNVTLTGGTGTGAKAKIYVSGGGVANVVTTTQGTGYHVGDVLTGSVTGGTGFSAAVQGIQSCLAASSSFVPALDTAYTVTYTVDVFNQQLTIQPAASFGGGRTTILNAIKVAQRSTPSIPATPTGLAATGGNAVVNLSWTATSGATTYNIYRSTTARGFYRLIAAPTTNSYADTIVTNGKTYHYIISAANSAGASAKTSSVNATPGLTAPSAPTGIGASGGNAQVIVSWTASATATSYNVKRSTTSGSGYSTVGSPSASPFTDTGRTNGTTYYYVVSALNAAGESANSSQASATPAAGGSTGVWSSVTPGGITLDPTFCGGGNFGTETVGADTAHPGTLYSMTHCQGIWKSTDYGQSWAGPVNTGTNGTNVTNCGGGITVAANGTNPVIYESCIRGNPGLWKSTDGGVNWASINLVPPLPSGRPDVYPVSIDPYNVNHVLAMGHEQDFLLETTNGGTSWTSKTMPTNPSGGTAFAFFIDTGNATTTGQTWLWIAQQSGGIDGTWRTTNGATSWTRVDNSEHPHGDSQIYQPDTSGVVYTAGYYGNEGNGVLRSTDYGATWAAVGNSGNEALVWGTPGKKVYAIYGWSTSDPVDPSFESAAQPGTGTWTYPTSGAPSTFNGGPHQVAVVNDGTHNIFLCACGLSGLQRFIEP